MYLWTRKCLLNFGSQSGFGVWIQNQTHPGGDMLSAVVFLAVMGIILFVFLLLQSKVK